MLKNSVKKAISNGGIKRVRFLLLRAALIYILILLSCPAAATAADIGLPSTRDTGTETVLLAGAPEETLNPDSAQADSLSTNQFLTPIELSDTIPESFFRIMDSLGLNNHAVRLISRFKTIPESDILEAISLANTQVEYKRANAYSVLYVIRSFCRNDSVWASFFSDLEPQIREPDILRFNFRDDQKWKSYALHELLYSTFFQELLLIMGNIGIADSRDGRQWLDGWPREMRWKYREYRFEYMPEDMKIRVMNLRKKGRRTDEAARVRLLPSRMILSAERGDTLETPYRIPRL
ncbi:MAG: hypothetical protein U9N45_06915 [Gemmatimonadota bacterium]|nr:hypothetical protein [Gemmatimonadota bacterium]